MFFNKYPYDSAHELNLDWILQNMEKLIHIYDELPSELQAFVDQWLSDHPEATTTVQDGSLTPAKLLANNPSSGQVLTFNGSGFEWKDTELKGKFKIVQVDLLERSACTLLINDAGEYVIIDFGRAGDDTLIEDAITRNGGTICKGIIISHFHFDHYGSYPQVLSDITIDPDAKAYIQARPLNDARYSDGGVNVQNVWDAFVAFAQQNNIDVVIPSEFVDYEIMGLPVKFYNSDVAWAYADPTVTELYNNTSLCNTFDLGCAVFGCWGDIYYEAEKHIVETNAIPKTSIMLAPHHGLGTKIYRSFIEKVSPSVILTNLGSQSTEKDSMFYSSNVRQYADETVKPVLDVTDGTVVIDISADGTFATKTIPVYYPQVIRHYPAMRNALSLRNEQFSNTSSTGIKDILLMMEDNAEITMYGTNTYQIALDLGVATTAIYNIKKTTGGSTNALSIRQNAGSFFFTIDVQPIVSSGKAMRLAGYYDGTTWNVTRATDNKFQFMFNVGTDGTITPRSGFPTSFTSRKGYITFPVGGQYIIHLCNTVSANGTVTIGSFTSSTIYSHSATFTARNFSAGEVACSSTGGTMTVLLECVDPSLDISVFA